MMGRWDGMTWDLFGRRRGEEGGQEGWGDREGRRGVRRWE